MYKSYITYDECKTIWKRKAIPISNFNEAKVYIGKKLGIKSSQHKDILKAYWLKYSKESKVN